jgi:hypothetical protein
MSDVIDFLESWGRDAQLRHATGAELTQAMINAQIDPFVRKALLSADRRHLEFLVGAQPNVCCMINVPTDTDDENEVREAEQVRKSA